MDAQGAETPKKGSKATKWLIGCAIAIVVIGLLCAFGAWATWKWGKGFVFDQLQEGLVQAVEESDLPPEQVDSIVADLGRLRAGIDADEVDLEEFGRLVEEIESGPLPSLFFLHALQVHVAASPGLSVEEKESSVRVVQRAQRGLQEGGVSRYDLEQALDLRLDMSSGEDPTVQWDSPDELRAATASLKALVDERGVPDEPYQVDVAEVFGDMVDRLLE